MPLQQISVSPLDWVKETNHSSRRNNDWKLQEPVLTTSIQNPPERCASQASSLSNSHDICRICHCEGDNEVPLIAPCYCSGSLRYVHQACLQQWIKSSDIRSCELCKFQFIMQSKIKPFSEWEALEISGVERRKLLCSITFHVVALICVVWSLYVLIDRTAEEMGRGVLEWPFWTKLIVVAIGFTGGLVFMYIQCKAYLHWCRRWRAFNRVIYVQNAPEKVAVPPLAREESLFISETCCGVVTVSVEEGNTKNLTEISKDQIKTDISDISNQNMCLQTHGSRTPPISVSEKNLEEGACVGEMSCLLHSENSEVTTALSSSSSEESFPSPSVQLLRVPTAPVTVVARQQLTRPWTVGSCNPNMD